MPPLMQLPQYEIRNALVNFQPVSDAIDGNRAYGLKQREADLRDKQFGLDEQRLGIQQRSADQDYQHKAIAQIAGLAQHVETIQDPNQRAQAWQQVLARHPNAANLPDQYRDPMQGPKLVGAEARGYLDPLAEQAKRAGIAKDYSAAGYQNAHAEQARAQTEALKNDPDKQMIRDIFGSSPAPQAAPAPSAPSAPRNYLTQPGLSPSAPSAMPPPAPGLKPMSFEAPQQGGGDPNLIRVADGQPGQAQPQAQPDTVTVSGKVMTRQQAENLRLYAAMKKNSQLEGLVSQALDGRALEKGARTELDKTRINYTQALGRLDDVEKQFDANFLKAGTQISQWFDGKLEKAGVPMNPQSQQEAAKFHQFRAASIGHFNQVLKEMSGTAVSAQEFERVVAQLPNPGTGMVNGVLDGDSPTQFKAKMVAAKRMIQLAAARANYIADKGFKDINEASMAVPLDAMPRVIQQRTNLLQQNFQQQGVPPDQIPGQVQRQLKQEFGI